MKYSRRSGISLAIVAVLLVIIGSAVSMMVMRKDREAVWNPITGSHTDIAAIEQALIAYQRTYHRLPCVAARTAMASDANFGVEIADCATGVAATGGTVRLDLTGGGTTFLRIGAVPHRTLGLSETGAEDEWSNRLLYAVSESLTDPYQFTNGVGVIRVDNASTTLSNEAAFVIVSHGKDGKGAFGAKGTSVGKACTSTAGLDQENCDDNDGLFIDSSVATEAGAAYFDDLIAWEKIDSYAQATNRPCLRATIGDAGWGSGCTNNTWADMLSGESQNNVANTNTVTHVGIATLTCTNGALAPTGTCDAHCASSSQSWLTNCSANVPIVDHGTTSVTINNTAPGYTGSVTFTCTNGSLSPNSPTCSAGVPMNGCDGSGGCFDNCECRPNGSFSMLVGWPTCSQHRCDNGSWTDMGGADNSCMVCP